MNSISPTIAFMLLIGIIIVLMFAKWFWEESYGGADIPGAIGEALLILFIWVMVAIAVIVLICIFQWLAAIILGPLLLGGACNKR